MSEKTVMQAKRYGVLSCTPQSTLLSVAQRTAEEDVSALVVVDSEGCLAGVISRTDLLRASLADKAWAGKLVKDYMSPDVVTVGLQTPLSHVASLLIERQIHRVVVVREEGGKRWPMAVVSAADLVYHLVREHGQTTRGKDPHISSVE